MALLVPRAAAVEAEVGTASNNVFASRDVWQMPPPAHDSGGWPLLSTPLISVVDLGGESHTLPCPVYFGEPVADAAARFCTALTQKGFGVVGAGGWSEGAARRGVAVLHVVQGGGFGPGLIERLLSTALRQPLSPTPHPTPPPPPPCKPASPMWLPPAVLLPLPRLCGLSVHPCSGMGV
jgi:hypothetical protein